MSPTDLLQLGLFPLRTRPLRAVLSARGMSTGNTVLDLHNNHTTHAANTHHREVAARLPRRVEIRDGKIRSDTRT
ncbi:hypothetical protein FKR81_31525 [Lentzea tibetensis]|uniref:Uncharacterized protein n=1 Tax=Lentzea tibetensis TaxID=2591470 RepID=A0A563EKU2_9PSEU|nr:hypothetical protein [Lentzea tibetensis]TWP47497.1 hypothetical protein FKR81_31525 [Lentzea tibetensis]